MIIKNISLQNFRSYSDDEFTLTFSPNINTLIGENNVGKTTILEALKKILNIESLKWDPEDFFARDTGRIIKISIECILDDDQIKSLISILGLIYNDSEFKKYFSNQLIYSYTRMPGKNDIILKIGFLQIENGIGFLEGPFERAKSFPGVPWENIRDQIAKNKLEHPKSIIERLFEDVKKQNPNSILSITFPTDIQKAIIDHVSHKIIILEEFREKPQTTLNDLSASPSGRDLASVLYHLKNGEFESREKYDQIQKKFNDLFPHLTIEITVLKGQYNIEIQKDRIASTTNFIGSGIIQTLFLLTHTIAHSDKVLLIDTPEIQLHPHVQRRLGRLLQSTQGSQIILITHSPYYLPITKESRLIRFVQKDGKTRAICPEENYFTKSDYNIYDQILTIDNKEFFFSRFVVLVEGMSDQWVMQIFTSAEGFDLDEHGISVVSVNGIQNFKRYPKILEGYQIPWIIMADTDKKREIVKILDIVKKEYPSAQIFLLPGEIEDLLNPEFMREGGKLFGNGNNKKDKPLKARYAAKKMVEKGMPVPEAIKQVIEELKKRL